MSTNRKQEDETFSLKTENEILKLQMRAQYGAQFIGDDHIEIDAEVEHQFLNQILEFEDAFQQAQAVKLEQFLGHPTFAPEKELDDRAIHGELAKIYDLFELNGIQFHAEADYPARQIYRFITEELMFEETLNIRFPGFTRCFIYEEFHPNHELDIRERTRRFFSSWFSREVSDFEWDLDETFIISGEQVLGKEDAIEKIRAFFRQYPEINLESYLINHCHVKWDEQNGRGLGHTEGDIRYLVKNTLGEQLEFDGSFRIDLANETGCWKIFHFQVPGFSWHQCY